jgi:hypothetical protein
MGCELAQHLTIRNQTKPRSDVYIVQILTKVPGGKAGEHQIGPELFCEV